MSEPKTAEVKVVPVEPTEAMIEAMDQAIFTHGNVVDAYRAMLAASPPAGTGEGADLAGKLMAIRDKFLIPTPDKDFTDYAIITRCIAALSAQPVSPSEGEAVAWRYRWKGENHTRGWRWIFTKQEAITAELRGYEVRSVVEARPASDQSDTERMRAALEWAKDRLFWHHDLTGADRMAAALAEKAANQ